MGVVKKAIKSMFTRGKWKILRGDTVQIMAGKDKGQNGTVSKVIRDEKVPRVIVEGRNLAKRHVKRQGENPGGIVTSESPLHYSNVQLIDPVTNAPVRVTWRFLEDGSKVRVTRGKKASGSVVPRPEILKQRRKPRPLPGPKDTSVAEAGRETAADGDAPSHPDFTAGILPPRILSDPALLQTRPYSTLASGSSYSSSHQLFSMQQPGRLASRLFIGSWRGFAASMPSF